MKTVRSHTQLRLRRLGPAGHCDPMRVARRPAPIAPVLAPALILTLAVGAAALLTAAGCQANAPRGDAVPPPPALEGPEYLHGTIGSYTRPRGFEPVPVGAYGLVVDLPGTGSADVPAFLRQAMERQMSQRGVGSVRFGMAHVSPRRMLQSENTAVVAVRGIIPPGATRGSRFDVLVTALPGTQTTNLEGGRLWSVDLSTAGLSEAMLMEKPLATGQGSLIVDPLADEKPRDRRIELKRQGVILSGGVVARDRPLHLVLNRPDWTRSRQISDRINERFPREPDAGRDTAVAQSDALIEINVPRRFRHDPAELLRLIQHTYIQRTPGFEQQQARRLGRVLVADTDTAESVSLAWQVLGRTALPEISNYYEHEDHRVQWAALRAGARLGDHNTVAPMVQWARSDQWRRRIDATMLMRYMSNNAQVRRTLRQLLDDDDRRVRIAAYENLAATQSPLIRMIRFGEGAEAKFRLDLVPAEEPLIYITQVGIPRIVVFNPNTSFKPNELARLWDNRLMLRREEGRPLEVFYQPYRPNADGLRSPAHHYIAPTVAHMVSLLGHKPTMRQPEDGFDLSYSEVSNALYNLHRQGALEADLEVRMSDLASVIADIIHRRGGYHPEHGPDPDLRPLAAHGEPIAERRSADIAAADDFDDEDIPMPMVPRGMEQDAAEDANEGRPASEALDMLELPRPTSPTRLDAAGDDAGPQQSAADPWPSPPDQAEQPPAPTGPAPGTPQPLPQREPAPQLPAPAPQPAEPFDDEDLPMPMPAD